MATELKCPHCQKEFVPTMEPYQDDYLFIDCGNFTVMVDGKEIHLTPIEHRLLECLVANAGRKLRHKTILSSVWGWEYIDDIDHLRIYIWHLRHKIEPDPAHPRYIICEPGIGYYFAKQTSP